MSARSINRGELTGPSPGRPSGFLKGRRAADSDFLPPVLQILETPPSPIRMAMIGTLCALTAATLAWSYLGHVDTVATAQGKIQPVGRVKLVQPMESGTVGAVFATNGTHVERGDLLIALDPAEAAAEVRAAELGLASVRAEMLRRTTASAAANDSQAGPVPTIAWDSGVSAELRQREDRVLAADLQQLGSSIATIEAQRSQKQRETEQLIETMAAEAQLIATLQRRVDMRSELIRVDAGTKSALIDALETLQYQITQRAVQKGELVSAQTAQDILAKQGRKAVDDFIAVNAEKLGEAERQAETYDQTLAKARAKLVHMNLTAPVSGVVQASTVANPGQVLGSGQEVMRIVPDGTVLEAQVYVRNQDIGMVEVGQAANVKVEAFPFTRYGTISAHVTQIARDAVPEPDASLTEGDPIRASSSIGLAGAQRTQNLVFPVWLALDASSVAAEGRDVALLSGMTVTADLRTGRRRILDYLLSPIREVSAVAMRER